MPRRRAKGIVLFERPHEPSRRRRSRVPSELPGGPMTKGVAERPEGPRIELRDLAKSFRTPGGRVEAVRGIDVAIARGETVALLGPNGAGKSTTIDMLLGLAAPDRGTVSLFARPPSDAISSGA